jgi:hypothetical protein
MNSARGCSRFHFVRATRTSEGMRGDSQKLTDRRLHYLHHRITWPLAVASRNARFATPRPSACRLYCWAPRRNSPSLCPSINASFAHGHEADPIEALAHFGQRHDIRHPGDG